MIRDCNRGNESDTPSTRDGLANLDLQYPESFVGNGTCFSVDGTVLSVLHLRSQLLFAGDIDANLGQSCRDALRQFGVTSHRSSVRAIDGPSTKDTQACLKYR